MNIPIPKGMKSPTIIIISNGQVGNSQDKLKRMDDFEKKFYAMMAKLEKKVNRKSSGNLEGSFDKLYKKMEELIKSSRPRMYPSPS